jgi:hypothetical protein
MPLHHVRPFPQNQTQASSQPRRNPAIRWQGPAIASFGSVEVPPSIAERLAFWRRLHQRLATLANRVDDAARGKILGDIQPEFRWSRSMSSAN